MIGVRFLLEYFLNMTFDRFYSLGCFMPRHHTWEDTRTYIYIYFFFGRKIVLNAAA